MPELFLLTGEIHSGKTTSLLRWSESRNDVHGILTPVVNGKRMFMDIFSKELFPMEASSEEEVLEVGRYRFSKAGFEKASSLILQGSQQKGWLVIDEIGPLELKKSGFCQVLKDVLDDTNRKLNVVLVVRASLVQQVIHFFQLEQLYPVTVPLQFFEAWPS